MFGQLMEAREGNRNFMFSYALCCHKLGDIDEAKRVLFRLAYEHPDDREVAILLASILLLEGKIEDAYKYVEKMQDNDLDDQAKKELVVIRALCLLALNRRDEAVRCYAPSIGQLSESSSHYKQVKKNIATNFEDYKRQFERLGLVDRIFNLFTCDVYKQVKARE